MKYPKVQTLWKRDENTHKVIKDDLSLSEFALPNKWVVSEKVDGTNVRVIYCKVTELDGEEQYVRKFAGKTDEAMLHPALIKRLEELFTFEKLAVTFPDVEEVILFGEGYGSKVNGIKGYGVEAEFILFDVAVKNEDEERSFKVPYWWMTRANVKDIAQKLGVQVVYEFTLQYDLGGAVGWLRNAPLSVVARNNHKLIPVNPLVMEGIVCRTEPMLLTRDGSPLMWKLKLRDFK